jgi:hypothetical protein
MCVVQLISLVIGVLATIYVVGSTANRGLARFLAPESIAIIMLFAIFSVRPLFSNRFAEQTFYGYVPSLVGERTALLAGIVCMACFAAGCFFWSVRPARAAELAARVPKPEKRLVNLSAKKVLVVSVVGAVVYALMLVAIAGTGTVAALSGGRSADVVIAGVPEVILLVPMTGSIVTTLFIINRRHAMIIKSEAIYCVAAVGVSLVLLSQLGNRRFLIPAALMPLMAMLVRKTMRIRAYHVVLALVGFVFIAIVPMVRSAGARMPGENLLTASWRYLGDRGISGVLTPVFASYDTEMLDYIALMSQKITADTGIGFGMGRGTILEFLLRPLPSSVTGVQYSDQLLTSIWGGGCGQPVCPVASVAGVFYFEGGLIAVALGTFAFAAVLRFLSNRMAYSSGLKLLPITCVTVASAFALIAARTNTIHSLWWVLYALALVLVVYRVVSSPATTTPRSNPSVHLNSTAVGAMSTVGGTSGALPRRLTAGNADRGPALTDRNAAGREVMDGV